MAKYDLEITLPKSGKVLSFIKTSLTLGESMGLNEILLSGKENMQAMLLEIIKNRGYLDGQRISTSKNLIESIPNGDFLFLLSNNDFMDMFTYYVNDMTGGFTEKKLDTSTDIASVS